MNRVATAGELSASIAHEVNQPITGIVTRASAARRWLAGKKPDIEKARQALDQIVIAGHRAAEIFKTSAPCSKRIRAANPRSASTGLSWAVLALVHNELQKTPGRGSNGWLTALPTVTGNEVQLQQVILNLVMNAIEAMHSTEPRGCAYNPA